MKCVLKKHVYQEKKDLEKTKAFARTFSTKQKYLIQETVYQVMQEFGLRKTFSKNFFGKVISLGDVICGKKRIG